MVDWLTPEQRSRNMSAIRAKDTKPELIVRKLAFSMGYRYRLHLKSLPGRPDLAFPRLRKIIEVRGCFWHRHTCKDGQRTPGTNTNYWAPKIDQNVRRDRQNEEKMKGLGWKVFVIWECETKNTEVLKKLIVAFLGPLGSKNGRETKA
jgi:DNA mismatch endonuclease, patch repair protein